MTINKAPTGSALHERLKLVVTDGEEFFQSTKPNEPVSLMLPKETQTNLRDVGHLINTSNKKEQGTVIYDSTNDQPCYATGSAASSVWNDAAGSTLHTPV